MTFAFGTFLAAKKARQKLVGAFNRRAPGTAQKKGKLPDLTKLGLIMLNAGSSFH